MQSPPVPFPQIEPFAHEGETRIRDIDLAGRLGFAAPIDIRKLVRRYADDLARMGVLATVAKTSGAAGGRPATEFYLNRKQAIFITAKSETAEATDITIEIIERFDAYERGTQPDAMALLNDPSAMRGLLLTYSEKVLTLQAENAVLAPKADALDRLSAADGDLCITDAAKALQQRPKDLFELLKREGWIYKRAGGKNWLGYSTRVLSGLLTHKVSTVERSDGSEKIVEQVLVTAKGITKLSAMLGEMH